MSDIVQPADNVALNLIQFINNASVKMMRALSCVGVADQSAGVAVANGWAAALTPSPNHHHHRRLLPCRPHRGGGGAGRSGLTSDSPPPRLSAREAREATADPYGRGGGGGRRRRTPDGRALHRASSGGGGGGMTASTSSSSSTSGSSDYSAGGAAYPSPRAVDSPPLSGDDSVFDTLLVAGSSGVPSTGSALPAVPNSYDAGAFASFDAPSMSSPTTGVLGCARFEFGSSCAQQSTSGDGRGCCDAPYHLPSTAQACGWAAPQAPQPLASSPPLPPQPNSFEEGASWRAASSSTSCDYVDGGYYYYSSDGRRWPSASISSWDAASSGLVPGFRNLTHAPQSQPPSMVAAVGCLGSSPPLGSICPADTLLPPPPAASLPESVTSSGEMAAAGWRPGSDASASASLDCAPSIGDMLDGLYDLLSDCSTAASSGYASRSCAATAPAALQASLFAQCA